MLKPKYLVLAAIPFVLGVSACSSTGAKLPKTTTTIPATTTTTINMLLSDTTTTAPTLTTTIDGGTATTTTAKAAGTTPTPTTISASAKDWEVVVGIFSTKALAQAQLDKLTKAGFAGFTIKPLPSKFAVVKVGFTNAEATALMKKINAAKVGTATIFHLTSSATSAPSATATNFEVVDGIYTTKAAAQTQLDKLTKAGLTGFSIKTLTSSFAVVKAGLTNAEALALVKKVDAAGLGPSRVKQL